ncbi:glycosyltransferase [Thermodesulfobacteriota bacterium]
MKKNLNNTISIVTPSLNQGDYIEETIQSVINQAGEFFIDYIIADGGSRDRTVEVIKKWEDQINNKKFKPSCQGIELRWWSKKDKGQTDAIRHTLFVLKAMSFLNISKYCRLLKKGNCSYL